MKILHVIPSLAASSGGPAQAIIPMCRALKFREVDVLVATTDADMDNAPTRNTVVDYEDIPTIFFPSQLGKSFKFSRPMSAWLNESVRQFDLVHIHAVFNHACVAAARACLKSGVPYIIRPLGTLEPWSMKQKKLRKQLFWQFRGEKMLRDATAVHYTTLAEQESVERTFRLNNGKVIPLAIELDVAVQTSPNSQLSSVVPEVNGSPYVLVMSRLHAKKGLDVLIDAFLDATATDDLRNWRLVIAGSGEVDYVRLLQNRVARANGNKRVLFSGWLNGEQKWQVLRQASLLALPSYQENFGFCVLEALTCGVPVLVSPHVNLANEIERFRAGWISSVRHDHLESALRAALASEDERRRRGNAAKLLSKEFSLDRMADELINLYSTIGVSHLNEHNTVTC